MRPYCDRGHDQVVHGKLLFGRIRCMECRRISAKKNTKLGTSGWELQHKRRKDAASRAKVGTKSEGN